MHPKGCAFDCASYRCMSHSGTPFLEVIRMEKTCGDRNCPIHGNLKTRGLTIEGKIVSDKMQGTVIVQKESLVKVKKYERYKRMRSKIPAHNPPCINARTGDKVKIRECKRLSKTVSFVIVEKLK